MLTASYSTSRIHRYPQACNIMAALSPRKQFSSISIKHIKCNRRNTSPRRIHRHRTSNNPIPISRWLWVDHS